MRIEISSIKNPQIRVFYSLWWPQRQVIYAFFLHIGWNLALMDHLNIPRFASLIQYWGP